MIASTTKLNTPGIALGKLDGVHALTDVTGFGLLGHLLEICRGSKRRRAPRLADDSAAPRRRATRARRDLHRRLRPQLGGLRSDVSLGGDLGDAERALLTDPQTSGGLLVACAADAVDDVLAIFRNEGFERAAVIGEIVAGPPRVEVRAA